ncbi:MAG: hypothetical protein ACRC80_28605, partial [Waterburya sp.]
QDAQLDGWKYKGLSSNGLWGKYRRTNEEFDREQRERYREERKREREAARQKELDNLAKNALSPSLRDRITREIVKLVGLTDADRNKLLKRGLTAAQIQEGLFFSIKERGRIGKDFGLNMPGVYHDQFSTFKNGFACHAFDYLGRANGWQMRTEEGNAKYPWAKSLVSVKTKNGELPITWVNGATDDTSTLYLAEGLLKPFIAAKKFGINVLGASGGLFAASPQEVFQNIEGWEKSNKREIKELVIVPDAGDVINPQVVQRISKQIAFIQELGKSVKVLWWGQVTKKKKDIDELELHEFSQAQLIEPELFLKFLEKTLKYANNKKKLKKLKKFTPDLVLKQRYLTAEDFRANAQTGASLYIKAPMGSGKTESLIEFLNHKDFKKLGILNCGYRNVLLFQFNERAKTLNFHHLQDEKANKTLACVLDPKGRVSTCVDSLHHLESIDFSEKIIVLDEIVSVVKHFLYSETLKNRSRVAEVLKKALTEAYMVIGLDGAMQDWVVDLIEGFRQSKSVRKIELNSDLPKAPIFF